MGRNISWLSSMTTQDLRGSSFWGSKDEAPEAIIKCLKQVQVRLNAIIRNVRTDNGTEFVNQTLREYYENVEISHQTSLHCFCGKKQSIQLVIPKNDWDILFQPMFDEFFNPPLSVASSVPVDAAQIPVDPTSSPVSISIDQDEPSTSNPSTQEQEQSLIIFQGVGESSKIPHFYDDPLHEDSTSHGSSSNVRPSHTPLELLGKWTKKHPLAYVIGDLSHSVSTRKQLKIDAMWCYFDAFLTSVEPRNFKEEMLKSSWIDAMQ
ncbi:retrovirus-related pol polyprotein from transposon TNT 1-94 [Tanacetum coccineum]